MTNSSGTGQQMLEKSEYGMVGHPKQIYLPWRVKRSTAASNSAISALTIEDLETICDNRVTIGCLPTVNSLRSRRVDPSQAKLIELIELIELIDCAIVSRWLHDGSLRTRIGS
jgi:hypothetical protein